MSELRRLVAEELSAPVDPRVNAMATAIAAKHGAASRAVLFYGSCLRQSQLDGLMLDFYLIVSDYRAAYDKRWLAAANRLIPPNVFYFEHDGLVFEICGSERGGLRARMFARGMDGLDRRALRPALAAGVERGQEGGASADRYRCEAASALLGWTLPLADRADVRGAVEAGVRADVRSRVAGGAVEPSERDRRCRPRAIRAVRQGRAGAAAGCGKHAVACSAVVAGQAAAREALFGGPLGQGEPDLLQRRRLHRVEDQPPCGDGHQAQAVAAAPSVARGDHPASAS